MIPLAAVLWIAAACSDNDPGPEPPPPPPPPPPGPVAETYEIGDHYKNGITEGIVFRVDETGEHGMILSLDEAELIWSTENVDLSWTFGNFSLTDGSVNLVAIKTLEDWGRKYPAFRWCNAKNILSQTAWYLPALFEMQDVFYAFNGGPIGGGDNPEPDARPLRTPEETQAWFNKCLTDAGGAPLTVGDYWTSSEYGSQVAYVYSFTIGDFTPYDNYKEYVHRVRAVRKF